MRHANSLIPGLDALRRACVRSLLISSTVLTATATTLSAQMAVPIGAYRSDPGTTIAPQDSNHPGRDPRYLNRIGPAAIVGIGSAVVLGTAVYRTSNCSGDSCLGAFYGAVLSGAFVGIVGSAVGAAAPRGRGLCTGMQRFGMGLGGAFLGALAGLPLAYVSGPIGLVATVPIGSVMFMRNC